MELLLAREAKNNPHPYVLVIQPLGNNYHLWSRVSGFVQYMLEHVKEGGMEYIKEKVDDEEQYHAFMEAYFSRQDVLPDGIFLPSSSVYYLASFLEKQGGELSRIPLIGYDLIPGRESLVEQGIIDFILTQQPEEQGYRGIMTLYDELVLNKKSHDKLIIPLNIITKENLQTFCNFWSSKS